MKTTIINKILLVLMLITAQQVSALEFQVDGIYYRTSIFTKNSAYVTHSGTSYTESVEYQGEVVIPESVTYNGKTYTIASIGGYAFAGCPGLTSVTIPNTVTTINQNAFNGCTGLKTIECKATTPPALGDNAFTSYDATLVVPSSSESVYKSAAGWSNFKFKEESSETPGSGENSGEDNTGGGSDSGEDSGTDSSSDNTYGLACKILNSTDVAIIAGTEKYTGDIVIPSQVTISGKTYTVTSIADDAFKGCTGLSSITIPSSITSIGSSSFDSCTNLNKVSISDMLSWCKITFANSLANPLYYAKKLYLNGTLVTKLEIPSAITEIKNYTFYNCTSISTIVFPSGILKIGNSAFVNCSNLTSVTIPNSVTTIDENAFNGCTGLASLTIGSSVGSIGNYAFGNCTGLKSVTSLNSTPPTCGTGVFQGVTISSIPLTVPAGSESLYKATYTWQDFKYKEEAENPGDDPAVDTSGLKYNIISSTDVEVVAGTEKYTGDIVIPSQTTIDGKTYNVTKIGIQAFNGCAGLTSITIPNSVTSIGNSAFSYCSGLTSVTIPDGVTSIGSYAFSGCSGLTSVTIPDGVTSIGDFAFEGCSGLTSVTSLNPTPPACEEDVFYNVSVGNITLEVPAESVSLYQSADTWKDFGSIKGIVEDEPELPTDNSGLSYNIISETEVEVIAGAEKYTGDIVIPSQTAIDGKVYNVTQIGELAFRYCVGLTSVTIGNSVTTIGDYAFEGCTGLTSVTIPNSVTSISSIAFRGCSGLTSIVVESGNTVYDSRNNCNAIIKTSTNTLILGCKNTTIPNSVTSIGDEAFYSCTGLTSVTIGNSVTSISSDAFSFCDGLESIKVDSGNSIYDSRDNCNAIIETSTNTLISGCKNTTIPNSVTSIGAWAFCGCDGLTSVTIPNSVTSIGQYAFGYCTGLTSITIPNSVINIDGNAFFFCAGLTSVTIPNSVISIGNNIFSSTGWYNNQPNGILYLDSCCLGYKGDKPTGNLSLNDNIRLIAGFAFSGCSGLTSVTIGNSVTSIGDYAFSGCSGLTSVTIPNSVTSIGDYAFEYCRGLSSITIPNSVTSIGKKAFSYCTGLTSVTIPNSVTSIGNLAFSNCSGLISIISLNPTPPTCGSSVFYNVSVGNITLEVPSESVSMYQSADTWKDFGTIEGYISYPVGLSKMWAIPADAATSLCSVRTGNGFGDTFFGSNYQAGVIEEWKDGVLVASYDVNKFCADNQLGETVMVIDSETGTETEKFTSYVLWTAVMVDDAGNVLANVGTGLGSPTTCQNWVLLPASNRNAMQLLHIDEFPSADVTLGRVDVPSRIVGNITDGWAYLYIPANGSALMPVMYIGLDGDGKIYYDAENSWILKSSVAFDSSTNVATFQTADEILGAADEAGVAAKTYVRWRGRRAPFTWNAETSQLEMNTSVPQGASVIGMDVFKLGGVEYIVLPINSATTGSRGSSVAVYNLADGSEVANWDSGCSVDYYLGSVQARVNPDGKTANIYVCGHKDCFGILKFYPGSSVKSIANEGLSYDKGSSAIDEIVTEENASVEYYNLQGVRVMNPEKGIYIKCQGGKTSKVVL